MSDTSPVPDRTGSANTGPRGDFLTSVSLAPLVVALGMVLVLSTWLGMRSIEQSKAEVNYNRDVLASGVKLQNWLDSQATAMTTMADSLAFGGEAEADAVASYLYLSGFMPTEQGGEIRPVIAVASMSIEPGTVTIDWIIDPSGPRTGTDVSLSDEAVDRIITVLDSVEPGAGTITEGIPELTSVLGVPERLNKTALIVGKSSFLPDAVAAIAILDPSPFVTEDQNAILAPAEFELYLEGELVATPTGQPSPHVGESYKFESLGANWEVFGLESSVDADHTGSWLLLLAGSLIAGAAGLLAQAIRSQSIVLGRLDRTAHDAVHDPLTGLLNRAGMTEDLENRLARRRANNLVGVLFLDLDRLKVINDSMGHSAGDEVLCIVADRLCRVIRDDDTVARFGGDEFVVISSGLPAVRDLGMLAQRILTALKEPARLSDETSQMIGGSIGISYVTKDKATAESLLRDADLAMYRAKEGGGGRFEVFDSELRAAALARLEVERELRRAIRTGQLVVHYQPIVNLDTGRVTKLEALVRWQHPERGMIPPGAFLSVAAESGLIVDVGEHVLREACRQAVMWTKATGRTVSVSVNVAERQLLDGHLVETVTRVLAETELPPGQLELEISEELIVDRLGGNLDMLNDLVNQGVRMALDDFGTGRASLSSLKQLDMVHTLKIDRAFVIDVTSDPVDRKIITAIVALAESLGMEIIAEGVEDEDQVTTLRDLGVSKIQGFYFARPDTSQKVISSLTRSYELPWEEKAGLD